VIEAMTALASGPITLVGGAGAGVTVVAGAVVQRLVETGRVERVIALRVDGCTDAPDLIRDVGLAVDAPLPGDEIGVRDALNDGPSTVVVLDDADLAPEAAEYLIRVCQRCHWVLTGRQSVIGRTIDVDPLPDGLMRTLLPSVADVSPYGGLPLLTTWPAVPTATTPWLFVEQAPPGAEILADLPMGLRGEHNLPASMCVPHPQRVIPRRSVREALGYEPVPSGETLTAVLRDRVGLMHDIAADLDRSAHSGDLRLYREAAYRCSDPDLSALAGAAAARLYLRFFQAPQALALAQSLLGQLDDASVPGRGLLRWLEGDALLATGSLELAHEAHTTAADELRTVGASSSVLIALARRCANRWAARGHTARARKWLAEARGELAMQPQSVALGDTLRIAGDLAAHAGEYMGAAALYDEALATVGADESAHGVRTSIGVALAAIAMARGQFAQADIHLASAAADARGGSYLGATVAFRRAELALRRGNRDEASQLLKEAEQGFKRAGTMRGLMLCSRLRGDIAGVGGDRTAASNAYRDAIQLCVRAKDLSGLRRVLRRALAVEREGHPGPHVDELQEHLDVVDVLLRVT
jgi:tetratricopeptide (TPR) repeat protein